MEQRKKKATAKKHKNVRESYSKVRVRLMFLVFIQNIMCRGEMSPWRHPPLGKHGVNISV